MSVEHDAGENPIDRLEYVNVGDIVNDTGRENVLVEIYRDWDARLRRIEDMLRRFAYPRPEVHTTD